MASRERLGNGASLDDKKGLLSGVELTDIQDGQMGWAKEAFQALSF